jgi:hypothetical protein
MGSRLISVKIFRKNTNSTLVSTWPSEDEVMFITKEISKHGVVMHPDELALLCRAFDAACNQVPVNDSKLDAEAMATRIVTAYQRGVRDEDDLINAALASPVRRAG